MQHIKPLFFIFLLFCFIQNLKAQTEDKPFTIVEEMPKYPGGEKALFSYLSQNIKYPEYAKENNITGTVYIRFIVNEDGSLSDFKVLKGLHSSIDNEAIRVIKAMPNWSIGKQNGKAVRVEYSLPIKFTLRGAPIEKNTENKDVLYRDSIMKANSLLSIEDIKEYESKTDIAFKKKDYQTAAQAYFNLYIINKNDEKFLLQFADCLYKLDNLMGYCKFINLIPVSNQNKLTKKRIKKFCY